MKDIWPKVDTLKAFATYGIAGYIIFRAFNMLAELAQLDPQTFGIAAIGIIGAVVAGVTGFLFGAEQGKQQQVSQQKAFESGLASPAPGSTTINATGDTNVKGGDPTIVKTPDKPG